MSQHLSLGSHSYFLGLLSHFLQQIDDLEWGVGQMGQSKAEGRESEEDKFG